MISIILPAYNEELAIGKVIDDVRLIMSKNGSEFEIIVVDDGSTDQTYEIARSRGVRLYRHPNNRGVGSARKTGILNARGEIIAMLDADDTYPAEGILELLKFIPAYDQVIGARVNECGRLKFVRWLVKKSLFCLAAVSARQKIADLNSGLRIVKKDIIMRYFHLIPDGFSCVTTMTLIFLYNGHTVKFIPTEYRHRIGKSKFNIFKDTFVILSTIIRLRLKFDLRRLSQNGK